VTETNDPADTALWRFSCEVYARADVAPACLALQDRHGFDVNLLLACCWAGRTGKRLDRSALADLAARVGDWQGQAVQPLRGVRRWLKHETAAPAGPAAALRERVKAQELEAERLEQAILADALASLGTPASAGPQTAAANLRDYFALFAREPGVADTADLAQLLTAAFPETLRPLDALGHLEVDAAGDAAA
jgi:uncharacterized protein (TIGR02444 family)